ncbi:MAG: hypothetical protein K2P81_07205 [Bacteriovoracaceae bacterium]|nr:hypothetical protein [Bacteriovoracaceae bacterium]
MAGPGKRHAFILGGTGAVGQQLLRHLVDSDKFTKIHAPTRRPLGIEHKKIIPHEYSEFFKPWQLDVAVNDFFYCFGSTLKKAGDHDKFREIELHTAHEALVVAKQTGVRRFYLVSSQGVSPQSMVFYLRVKAEVEKILKDHYFQAFFIYRPSLLLSPRPEVRMGELIAQKLLKPLTAPLQRYLPSKAPVQADQVARAMLTDAIKGDEGLFIRENRQIIELANFIKQLKS